MGPNWIEIRNGIINCEMFAKEHEGLIEDIQVEHRKTL
jgi:hypothetical protein